MNLPSVHLTEAVLHGVADSAIHAMPVETGGALIGWREGATVSVMDFIEIPSARAERSRYELRAADLNAALASYLTRASDTRLGYVGSWHTHPAAVSPSFVDKHTFMKTARAHSGPLAFLVAATDGRSTTLHTTWAGQCKGRHRLVQQEPITRRGQ